MSERYTRHRVVKSGPTLLVVEAQFRGWVHATFNSFLLEALYEGHPDHTLVFAAEPEHLGEVERLLARRLRPGADRIRFENLSTGPRNHPTRRQEFQVARDVLQLGRRLSAKAVICASASWAQLLGMSSYSAKSEDLGVIAVLHTHPAGFSARGLRGALSARIRRHILDYHSLLRGLLVFSESARAAATRLLRFKRLPIARVDPPYASSVGEARSRRPPRSESTTFGWLGNSGKGRMHQFLDTLRSMKSSGLVFDTVLVGYLNKALSEPDYSLFLEKPSTAMLDAVTYHELLSRVSHGILWSERENYDYRISAAFLDAVVAGVPGIYMATPFLEEFFCRFGECGVLCRNDDEMANEMAAACRGERESRGEIWHRNMRTATNALAPRVVGAQLKKVLRQWILPLE